MSGSRGIVACFEAPDAFLAALRRVRVAGYTRIEAFTPFPVEGLDELLPRATTPIGWIMLIAGGAGATGAYALQYWATHDYPLNVGGRPLHSWPAFVPVTFELGVLAAAIVGVLALGWLCRLPRLHHPVFEVPGFERASQDRLFLLIRDDDPRFHPARTHAFLAEAAPGYVTEVLG
ncbi:MAG TPA: DUF3341 domain-containing protein [Opitutus sp.]|nr:DUF3341 domain-containing protein [Opitutus sp.]